MYADTSIESPFPVLFATVLLIMLIFVTILPFNPSSLEFVILLSLISIFSESPKEIPAPSLILILLDEIFVFLVEYKDTP
ncbi:hypothetical protein MBCUT_01140 [Methanobrevibacter cuticularis]|uniref:Uncharacterized protein n=1 Tax=Methanobrevibacter cuticularis TaxID=47311 RepID=A0A166FIL4_9EURY|nr:hypothetical protein MBCUT_01140 [Methanobrevibacter cuticularis]